MITKCYYLYLRLSSDQATASSVLRETVYFFTVTPSASNWNVEPIFPNLMLLNSA